MRALDNWRLGEGSRIMTYLQPKRYRPMSLYGEVFQGRWNTVARLQIRLKTLNFLRTS